MTPKEKWVADAAEALQEKQRQLVEEGTPDESIQVQIAQLGQVWDTLHEGRKSSSENAA